MRIDSIEKVQKTYQRTLEEAAWLERLMQHYGGRTLPARPENQLRQMHLELNEGDQRPKYTLGIVFSEVELNVYFSLLTAIVPGLERRNTLATLVFTTRYNTPAKYRALLHPVSEQRMRDLLNLREQGFTSGAPPRHEIEITIADAPRFRELAENMIKLLGSSHEPSLLELQG